MSKTVILAAAILAAPAIAVADDADNLYKEGTAAMKAGRVHEACDKFEQSDKAKEKVETELALADCYEQDGRPVAAAKLLRSTADKDSKADRKKKSLDKAGKLEAKAPKLRITLSQKPDGLVIKVDGVEVPTTGDVMVDAGPHEVIATAPGYEGHASAAVDKDRAIVDVIVRMESTAPPPAPEPPPPAPKPEPAPAPAPADMTPVPAQPPPPVEEAHKNHRKRNGYLAAGVGAGALIGSVVFLSVSSSRFDDEHGLCPNSKCANQDDLTKATSLLNDGRDFRGIGIGLGIGGLALVGLGAYLIVTDHSESHVSFNVGHGNYGMAWTGRF